MVNDTTETIYYLHEKLGLEIHDTSVKVGFDYGGECLKVCLLIMAKDHIGMINEAGTSVKMIKKMKLNSVKKVQTAALGQSLSFCVIFFRIPLAISFLPGSGVVVVSAH